MQIKVRDGKPYIAYYNNTEAGQRSAVKLAVAKGTVKTDGSGGIGIVQAGVDADGFVTGEWDCMTVPTVTPVQGGRLKFKKGEPRLWYGRSSRPNSYDAIRIAYKTSMDFNNTGTDVEGWETMTAPLNERAANGRICIETQAKHYNATEKLPVAVGFTNGSDYRAAFYVGK